MKELIKKLYREWGIWKKNTPLNKRVDIITFEDWLDTKELAPYISVEEIEKYANEIDRLNKIIDRTERERLRKEEELTEILIESNGYLKEIEQLKASHTNKMKNIPEKIYLVISKEEIDEDQEAFTDFNKLDHEFVCWCPDKHNASDIEYVLSDKEQGTTTEAVEFANWCMMNEYESIGGGNWHDIHNNVFSTEELYKVFKQSQQK